MVKATTHKTEKVAVGTPLYRAGRRDLLLLPIGFLIFWFIYQGPPVEWLGDFDMRFGLHGPIATDPWKWIGAGILAALVLWGERRNLASMLLSKPSA